MTVDLHLKAAELQLGDVLKLGNQTWDCAIVKKIEEHTVAIFRPYGTTADFSYTGGVICYVGIEEFRVSLESGATYHVVERKELR